MDTIIDKLQVIIENQEKQLQNSFSYIRLRDFYKHMNDIGLIKRQDYFIPPVDTIGKRLYEISKAIKAQ